MPDLLYRQAIAKVAYYSAEDTSEIFLAWLTDVVFKLVLKRLEKLALEILVTSFLFEEEVEGLIAQIRHRKVISVL